MRKILCILVILAILSPAVLSGCSVRGSQYKPDTATYRTAEEYLAVATHRYPIKTADLRYAIYDNCAVVLECVSENPNIVIPAYIEDVPVVMVEESAFKNNSTMQRLQLGTNLLEIKAEAFMNCTALTYVQMSGSINTFGTSCFAGCKRLKSLIIPAAVDTIPSNTFSDCSALNKVVIEPRTLSSDEYVKAKQSAKTIESGAFSNCQTLTALWIPNEVKAINGSVFSNRTTVIYGEESTAAAQYATDNLLDYVVLTREEFDSAARAYNPVGESLLLSEEGQVLKAGAFEITYMGCEYLDKIGSIEAEPGDKILKAMFAAKNINSYRVYFDGLNTSCESWARDKEGVMKSYKKRMILVSEKVSGLPCPAGDVEPGATLTFAVFVKVKERSNCVSVAFKDAEDCFNVK